MDDYTQPNPDELTLTYVSRWSWDFTTFIADAKISAFKNNKKVGEVQFQAPNTLDTSKFGDDEKRIYMMLQLLFAEKTINEAQNSISRGDI